MICGASLFLGVPSQRLTYRRGGGCAFKNSEHKINRIPKKQKKTPRHQNTQTPTPNKVTVYGYMAYVRPVAPLQAYFLAGVCCCSGY